MTKEQTNNWEDELRDKLVKWNKEGLNGTLKIGHYHVLKDFIEKVISQEKEKMIEEIRGGQRGLYHKIIEDHCDECRILTHIINLLQK